MVKSLAVQLENCAVKAWPVRGALVGLQCAAVPFAFSLVLNCVYGTV